MIFSLAIAVSFVLVLHIVLRSWITWTQHSREPPALQSSFPFVAPLVRLLRERTQFFLSVRRATIHRIYTLRLPGSRLYIINDLSLIVQAERQHDVLGLGNVVVKLVKGICGSSEETFGVLITSEDDHSQNNGYTTTTHRALREHLSPGKSLSTMNKTAISTLSNELASFASIEKQSVHLFAWITEKLTFATTDAVYGAGNPFREPGTTSHFWQFESDILSLLINALPSITVRSGYEARERLISRFVVYLQNGDHETASEIIKMRVKQGFLNGITLNEIARLEMAMLVAILSNTIPTAFWVLYHIYSSKETLLDCRQEVSTLNLEADIADITSLKQACPLLSSILNETLRYHNIGVSPREVLQDHNLAGQYLLRKGTMVLMPSVVQHFDTDIWGENAHMFRYDRFVKSPPRPGAFRGFGGGVTLCPGRHFARFEILAFAAMVLERFDIEPESSVWKEPTTKKAARWAAMPKPDDDIPVVIRPRE